MDFETYINRNLENGMQEELTMRIGDLVPDRDVNLEELGDRSTRLLQHLYRLMVESPHLELKVCDDMALYFMDRRCGHEVYIPWTSLIDYVELCIEKGNFVRKCELCTPTTTKEEKKVEKPKLKASDLKNANHLQFMFLEPEDKLQLSEQALRLIRRVRQVVLPHYKMAVEEGNKNQIKNTGVRLKNAMEYLRKELKVPCVIKSQ